MSALRQLLELLRMSLLSLPARLGASLVVVVGMTGVIAVVTTMTAVGSTFDSTLRRSGHDDRVIVLRKGAVAELTSAIPRESVGRIADAPGVAHGEMGALVSGEAFSVTTLQHKADGGEDSMEVRGVGIASPWIRPELKIASGRLFRRGTLEAIVGRTVQRQYRGVELGRTFRAENADWTIVGIFDSGGDLRESQLLVDSDTLMSASRRDVYSSVTALLQSPQDFARFRAALASDPSLSVDVYRESEYFDQQASGARRLFTVLIYGVGGMMMIGAGFAAANTMFASIASRSREIATLRAIGYRPLATVLAILAESALLAIAGALCGAALAWFAFSGRAFGSSIGGQTSQSIFELHIGVDHLVVGVLLACLLGLAGGLLPALRAASGPVAAALRRG